jgi:hypothetical protein
MQIPVYRHPQTANRGWSLQHKKYEAWVGATEVLAGQWYLSVAFITNPDGQKRSSFDGVISPDNFNDLAKEMMKVDPVAAIKAFGAAMQEIQAASIQETAAV